MSLLNPAYNDLLPNQTILPLLLNNINNKYEYYIKEILNSYIQYNWLKYLVKWFNYD